MERTCEAASPNHGRNGLPSLLADRVVVLAELQQLAELALDELELLAQRHRLALRKRDRAAAVGMRNLDLLQELGMLVEELRVRAQEHRDVVRAHSCCSFIP
jgi:hypothetical protein